MDFTLVLAIFGVLFHKVLNERPSWRHKIEPEFMATPTNITAYKGKVAVLMCHIRNAGPKVVVWRKESDNIILTLGRNPFRQDDKHISIEVTQIKEDEMKWDLIIKDVQPYHSGTYLCQVSATKLYTHYVTLKVLDQPADLPKNSSLKLTGTKYVDQGDSIHLECNITGAVQAPDDIDWYFKGHPIVSSRKQWRDRIDITKRKVGRSFISELDVFRSTLNDTGTYLCRGSELSIHNFRVDVLSALRKGTQERSPVNPISYQAGNAARETASAIVLLSISVFRVFIFPLING